MFKVSNVTLANLTKARFSETVHSIIDERMLISPRPSMEEVRTIVDSQLGEAGSLGFCSEADAGLFMILCYLARRGIKGSHIWKTVRSDSLTVDERRYQLKAWLDLNHYLPFGAHESSPLVPEAPLDSRGKDDGL